MIIRPLSTSRRFLIETRVGRRVRSEHLRGSDHLTNFVGVSIAENVNMLIVPRNAVQT
ncbi:hypothetical protein DFI02_1592 [Rhizobium sp. PP-F2F-G20b]|nr:hypothetical protein DFI02_1592 [Rhizobium sp. PP-F2F-G20b]